MVFRKPQQPNHTRIRHRKGEIMKKEKFLDRNSSRIVKIDETDEVGEKNEQTNTRTVLVIPMVKAHGRRFFSETGDEFVESTGAEYPYLADDQIRAIRMAQKEDTTIHPNRFPSKAQENENVRETAEDNVPHF